MLTEATDNAKNLTLAKINAIPELISIYVFGISTGMDFAKIASYARSNTAHIFNELKQGNVFYGSVNNNFSFAKLKSTIVDPWHYIGNGKKIINDGDFHKMTDNAKKVFGYNDVSAQTKFRSELPANRILLTNIKWNGKTGFSMSDLWWNYIRNGLYLSDKMKEADITDEMIISNLRRMSVRMFGEYNNETKLYSIPQEKYAYYNDYRSINAWIDRIEEMVNTRNDINSESETYFDKDGKEKQITYLDILIDMESGASEMMSSSKYMVSPQDGHTISIKPLSSSSSSPYSSQSMASSSS